MSVCGLPVEIRHAAAMLQELAQGNDGAVVYSRGGVREVRDNTVIQ